VERAFDRHAARRPASAWFALLLLLNVASCGAEDAPPPSGVLLDLTVLDIVPTLSGDPPVPLAQLRVCVLDDEDRCASTDTSGRAVLTLPDGERTGVTIVDERSRERIVKKLLPLDTRSGIPFAINTPAVSRLLITTLPVVTMQELDESTQGLVVAQAFYLDNRSLGIDGLSCVIDREDGTPIAGSEIWYAPTNGSPITTPFIRDGLTSDTGLAGTIVGPGIYRVRLDGAYDCAATSGWLVDSADANTWDVPARPGYFTDITAYCRKR
jgi:hypothetical protein